MGTIWIGAQALVCLPAYAQPHALDASEFQVNASTTLSQEPLGIARDPDGGFVAVWWSENSSVIGEQSIELRRYSAAGTGNGGEFQVNSVTGRVSYGGSVSADVQGNFVVVWESWGSTGDDKDWSIQARRFTAAGEPLDPIEFQVNTHTLSAQVRPRVDHDLAGNFVVVWYGVGDGSISSIRGRRFRADGTPLDPAEFQINTVTSLYQEWPSVAVAPGGEFVVAWESSYSLGNDLGYSVQARRFDADGVPVDPVEFQVNTYTTNLQNHADVAVSPSGEFVVVWKSRGSFGNDTDRSIQMRRFSSSGVPLDAQDRQVNTTISGTQDWPRVESNAEGDFVVVWHSETSPGDDPFWSIQGRRYRSDGTAVDLQEHQLNTYTTGFQDFPYLATTPEGDFVALWESYGSAGSDTDVTSVQARRFGRPTLQVTSTSGGTGGPGCTLRDAVAAAASSSPSGGCPAGNQGGVIRLPDAASIRLTETDNPGNGVPRIDRPVTVQGRGSTIERDPGLACPVGPQFRFFEVVDGGVLALEDLLLANGCLLSASGGAAAVEGGTLVLRRTTIEGNEAGQRGGAVSLNGGSLAVVDSTIRGNLAGTDGGGIAASGTSGWVRIDGSTISENSGSTGGGLWASGASAAQVRNSTFSTNEALVGGGAISVAGVGATALLEFATLTNNSSPAGSGLQIAAGSVVLHGSVVGDNAGGTDCAASGGVLAGSGANLDTDGSCAALAGSGVSTVASLGLAALSDQGGPTRVLLPLAGSATIDAAPACETRSGAVVGHDQRRYPRPTDDDGDASPACELGAVERGPVFQDGFETADTRRWSGSTS